MTRSLRHISMSPKKNSVHNKTGAFTLVETLLAMTIFAFIGLGIATSFFSGMKLWQRASGTDLWRNNMILNLEPVSRELRQSLNIPVIGFEGNPKSFSFPSISGGKPVRAYYYFDADSKMLKRSEYTMKDIIEDKIGLAVVSRDILSLDDFSVQYMLVDTQAKDVEWVDGWKKEDGIFTAIRFKYKSHNEEFQKTVFIPVS